MKEIYFCDEFFERLEQLALKLSTSLTGYYGGKHKINKYGQTVEFADFREYEPGDDIRRIDWNLFARLGKYFLKLYTDERQMHVRIFIDCSASMGFFPDKAEYALGMAVAIGYLAIRNNDKLSFYLLKNGVCVDPFGLIVGKNAFFSVIGKMKDITFDGEAEFSETIPNIANISSNDGLSVVVSDFLTDKDWQKAVDYFLFKKQQVVVYQVLCPEEISPTYHGKLNLVDCEGDWLGDNRNVCLSVNHKMLANYKKELENYILEIKQFCDTRGVTFFATDTTIPIERLIFKELC